MAAGEARESPPSRSAPPLVAAGHAGRASRRHASSHSHVGRPDHERSRGNTDSDSGAGAFPRHSGSSSLRNPLAERELPRAVACAPRSRVLRHRRPVSGGDAHAMCRSLHARASKACVGRRNALCQIECMRIASAIIVLLLSRTVAAQPSEEPTALPPTRAALELQELDRTHVVLDDSMLRKIRRLQGRRHGLLIGSLVPLTIGIGLTIRGARSGTDDGEIETLLGSIGIAAGILMLGRAPRVGRHANSLANPPSPATRQLQYERAVVASPGSVVRFSRLVWSR